MKTMLRTLAIRAINAGVIDEICDGSEASEGGDAFAVSGVVVAFPGSGRFESRVKVGDAVSSGDLLGTVQFKVEDPR